MNSSFPLGITQPGGGRRADNLVFAFVDLHDDESNEPDVYLVPSAFMFDYCAPSIVEAQGTLVRFHIDIDGMEPFKNNWKIIEEKLGPWDGMK
jgi:hypothetical protein